MTKGKTHEFKGNIYSEIPKEIAEKINLEPGEEIEFKNPYKDLIIIVPNESKDKKKGKDQKKSKKKGKRIQRKRKEKKIRELGPNELKILKKLGKMKHLERTPEKINEELSENEKKVYKKMLAGEVLFKYEKKGEERIGIDREYFPLVRSEKPKEGKKEKKYKTPFQELEEEKYMVISNRGEVEELQREIRKKDKVEEVKGVKDFDGKFYIMKKDRLREIEEKLEDKGILNEEKPIKKVAEELEIKEELSKTALVLLREEGKVIEKGKNVYQNA